MISLCPIEALDAAEALLHGELGEADERAARAHLAACASCRSYYASLAEERETLLSLGESHPALDAPLPAFEEIARRAERSTPAAAMPSALRQQLTRRGATFAFALAAAVPALLTARVALVGTEGGADVRIVALSDAWSEQSALSNGEFTPSEPLCRGIARDDLRATGEGDHVCSGDTPRPTRRAGQTTLVSWGERAVCSSSGSAPRASVASFASPPGLCTSED